MNRVDYAATALADLDELWDYTALQWGVDQAERYLRDIRGACDGLATGSRIVRTYPEKDGYFRYPVARHVVFYFEVDGGIRVMRVLHQRMDVGEWLE